MSFADSLASSDGIEEFRDIPSGVSTPDDNNSDNFENAGIMSRSHSRQSSLSHSSYPSSPSIGGLPSSILGRRQREFGQQTWSPREKVQIRDFASDKCAEYELSAMDRTNILKDSEVSFLILLSCFSSLKVPIAVNS